MAWHASEARRLSFLKLTLIVKISQYDVFETQEIDMRSALVVVNSPPPLLVEEPEMISLAFLPDVSLGILIDVPTGIGLSCLIPALEVICRQVLLLHCGCLVHPFF